MQKDVLEQINYGTIILDTILKEGGSVWDFSVNIPSGGCISVNGVTYSYVDMCQYALRCKREGRYADSIGGYIRVINECKKSTGKLYISVIRNYIKVLISANAFRIAYNLVGTALADMQQSRQINQEYYQQFMGYYLELIEMSKMVVDRNDLHMVYGFCAKYSGSSNYLLQSTTDEIKEEFRWIRTQVRLVHGQ